MKNEKTISVPMSSIFSQVFPSIAPAFLVSMGYIDPGKWAVAVDGGSRFGVDLILPSLIFNCIAVLCQYLAASIGLVTGKNLGQVFHEEYNRKTCILLGILAEVSTVAVNLTMILGIAHGFHLLLGLNMSACVFLTTIDAVLFPCAVALWDRSKIERYFVSVAGFTLLFYLVGVLASQLDIPVVPNGMFSSLREDSVYSLMSLLGANVTPHNFYFYSSFVQQHKQSNVSIGALCHQHFFAILTVSSGIFIGSYVVMNSAAAVFHSSGLLVLTFQDVLLLVDQIFRSPVVYFAFFLVIFIASQITALTCNIAGQVVWRDLFSIELPVTVHHVSKKAAVLFLALCSTWLSGSEGIYHLLILCQVVLAILLPTSVIPLFRVASSLKIMGSHKISLFLEMLALSAFLVMVSLNLVFVVELVSNNNSWSTNLKTNVLGSNILLFAAFLSLASTLWLSITPLKSSTDRTDVKEWDWRRSRNLLQQYDNIEDHNSDKVAHGMLAEHDAQEFVLGEPVAAYSETSALESDIILPEVFTDFGDEPDQSSVEDDRIPTTPTVMKEIPALVESLPVEIVDIASSDKLMVSDALSCKEFKDSEEKDVGFVAGALVEKKDDRHDIVHRESFDLVSGNLPTFSEIPGSFRSIIEKSDDVSSVGGSLSKLCGLGRAARRQLASVLDEFWGQLYDLHGKVTQEALANKVDHLLAFELKSGEYSLKPDHKSEIQFSTNFKHIRDSELGTSFLGGDYSFPNQQVTRLSGGDSLSSDPMLSTLWSSHMQSSNEHAHGFRGSLVDAGEKRYSSLRLTPYSNNWDYHPATMHGYRHASYLNKISTDEDSETVYPSRNHSTHKSTTFVSSYFSPPGFNNTSIPSSALHTPNIQSLDLSKVGRLNAKHPDKSFSLVVGDNNRSSVGAKKYYSLPDISGLSASIKNSSLGQRSFHQNSPIGSRPTVTSSGQSTYFDIESNLVPPTFDESPPNTLFTYNAGLTFDQKSLWAKQPFEQSYDMLDFTGLDRRQSLVKQQNIALAESETRLLQSFRYCVWKLMKLEGSEWLFRQNGGADEELIDQIALGEKHLSELEVKEINQNNLGEFSYNMSSGQKHGSVPRGEEEGVSKFQIPPLHHCGENCIWRATIVISFGVWSIHRILELSLLESRPELWGKYTYVLNRLQGIIDPAFCRPRQPITPCLCVQVQHPSAVLPPVAKLYKGRLTTSSVLLDLIKDVEIAISSRKGRTGTAAGDVAFPKGKENLVSVLKRYKRRLSNKPIASHDSNMYGSRKLQGSLSPSSYT